MSAAIYGLLAEFPNADALCAAAKEARAHGYTHAEAYSSFPVEGLEEVLGTRRSWVAPAALVGGVLGGAGTYFLQWYAAVIDYPINVGGRPLHYLQRFGFQGEIYPINPNRSTVQGLPAYAPLVHHNAN